MPCRAARRPFRAAFLALAPVLLAACATTVEPTPEGLAKAVRASETAAAEARDAGRLARAYAARRDWRHAADQLDRISFALRDLRRLRAGMNEAQVHAAAMLAAIRAEPADGATSTLASADAYTSKDLTLTDAVNQEARARDALETVSANLAAVERLNLAARRIGRTPARDVAVPRAAPTTLADDAILIPPDTGFDQDVFGSQR